MKLKPLFAVFLALYLPLVLTAQNRTQFAGVRNAAAYAYGLPTSNVPGLSVGVGTQTTGVGTLIVTFGQVTLGDGTTITPLNVTAPITVGSAAAGTLETVTPSAVSCSTPKIYNTCSVTATFTYVHGAGELISSGTYGLEEAINAAHGLGGLVAIDGTWTMFGGVTATITGNKGWTNVTVLDYRGTSGATSYKAASNGANMAATAVTLY